MEKLFLTDRTFSIESGSLNFSPDSINAFAEKYHCEVISKHPIKIGKHVMIAKRYPYHAVSNFFNSEYFTDTITYMIAYALWKYSELAISPRGVVRPELKEPLSLRFFGVDMSTTREYSQSKGGVEHWIGIARGMGCEIEISKGSTILANPMGVPYGQHPKVNKKVVDPFGLLKGKNLTTTQMEDVIEKKIAKEMGRGQIKEVRL